MIPWTALIGGVASLIDDLHTSDKERAELAIEMAKVEQAGQLAQIKVNEESAKHGSMFVAGARPAVIWVGVLGLAYQFLLYPMLTWGWAVMQAAGWVPADMGPPPILDIEALMILLGGVLGLGVARSVEKVKGVARDKL